MMNNEKEKDAIDTSKLDEILPKYDPLKLNSINLAQNYVSAFNTGMNIYQCVNQLQGYIEWVVKAVNDVVKSWNVQVGESIDQSKAIVRETTTEQFNVEWTNKQPELIEQVNTLTTNQFNEDWGVLENRINTTLETQNTNIQNIQNEQNELETYTNNNINAQNTKINSIQTQQTNLASNQTNLANQQTTLSNRMDTFTSLTSGSTTGDAELQDIRVGANGVTYNTAGDAVRGQYSQLKEDLSDSNLLLNYEYTKIDKGVSSEGSFVEGISSSGIIQLKRGQIIKLNANGWKNAYAMIAEYHGEGNLYTPLVISDVDGPKEYKYKATKDITVTCSFDGRYPAKIKILNTIEPIGYINALDYGFDNTGYNPESNDSFMVKYIKNDSNIPIYFPSGVYAFNNPINFPNECYLELSANAKFILYNETVQEYFVTIRKGSTASNYAENSYIKGGTFDANGNANTCMGFNKCHHTLISDMKIIGFTQNGIVTNTEVGFSDGVVNLDNIMIVNTKLTQESCGIRDNGLDTKASNIEVIDCKTGVYTICGTFYNLHCWIKSRSLVPGSLYALLDGFDIKFVNCVVDTYQYGFKSIMPKYGCIVDSMTYTINKGVFTDEMINQYNTYFIYDESDNRNYVMNGISLGTPPKYFTRINMNNSIFTNVKTTADNPRQTIMNYRNDNGNGELRIGSVVVTESQLEQLLQLLN